MRAGARIVPQDAEPVGGGDGWGREGGVGNNSKLNETHGKAQMYKKKEETKAEENERSEEEVTLAQDFSSGSE